MLGRYDLWNIMPDNSATIVRKERGDNKWGWKMKLQDLSPPAVTKFPREILRPKDSTDFQNGTSGL